jgi:ribosomal protein L10
LEPLNILRAQLEKSQSEQESQQLITSAKTSLVQAKQVLNELETKQDTISQQVTATHARMVGLAQEFNALSEQLALKAKELNQCSREHQNHP